jgi:hypothetical protein
MPRTLGATVLPRHSTTHHPPRQRLRSNGHLGHLPSHEPQIHRFEMATQAAKPKGTLMGHLQPVGRLWR